MTTLAMTTLALAPTLDAEPIGEPRARSFRPSVAARPAAARRIAHVAAAIFALLAVTIPDCCITGRHGAGLAFEDGAICHTSPDVSRVAWTSR